MLCKQASAGCVCALIWRYYAHAVREPFKWAWKKNWGLQDSPRGIFHAIYDSWHKNRFSADLLFLFYNAFPQTFVLICNAIRVGLKPAWFDLPILSPITAIYTSSGPRPKKSCQKWVKRRRNKNAFGFWQADAVQNMHGVPASCAFVWHWREEAWSSPVDVAACNVCQV